MHHVRTGLLILAGRLATVLGHVGEDHHLADSLKTVHGKASELAGRFEVGLVGEAIDLLDHVEHFAGWAQVSYHHGPDCEHTLYMAVHLWHAVDDATHLRKTVLELSAGSTTRSVNS